MVYCKALWLTLVTCLMISCNPAAALPETQRTGAVTAEVCSIASSEVADVIKLFKSGKSNVSVMTWLDRQWIDGVTHQDAYLANVMVKLLVPEISVALKKAFRPEAIIKQHKENCKANIGLQFELY